MVNYDQRMRSASLVLIIIALGLAGFFVFRGARELGRPPSLKLHIVTTFIPMYIFTKNITRDLAEVENLLPRGVGPHDYAFTPSDVTKVARADLIVKHGRGIDDWVGEVIRAAGRNDLTVIVASEGIEPHTGPPGFSPEDGSVVPAAPAPLVKPDPEDPHIWIDPFLAVAEVERIRDGLMARDPAQAGEYARNAETYLLRLLTLDGEIREAFRALPRRDFVAFHPAFRYFAYEYELREVAAIEEIPGEAPSPAALARIADEVERTGVNVIFSEPQFLPQIVETLARDYGLRVAELDPLETGETRPDYYEEVMRLNVQAIVNALGSP